MSQNYPYRRQQPLAQESQQIHGSYSSSNQRVDGDNPFYRQPSPLPSSSKPSVEPSYSVPKVDSTLSILSSYGLEPSDLSALAELPEDVLTLDALPRLLTEIKVKKGVTKPHPPSPAPSSFSSSESSHPKKGTIRPHSLSAASSSFSSSSSQAPVSSYLSAAGSWEDIRNKPVQYPLDHAFITHKPLPPEQVQDWQDRWGNPRQTCSGPAKSPSSTGALASLSSPGYIVDYNHKDACGEFGKQGRGPCPAARYENPPLSCTPAGGGGSSSSGKPPRSLAQSGSADYRVAPPPGRYQAAPRVARRAQSTAYSSSNTVGKIPCRKAAQDFHGTMPDVFPYACSLCDITCLSEKVWIQHLNGSQHAVAQLNLLNLFPEWDCRIESCRDDVHPERSKAKERLTQPLQPNYRQPYKTKGKKPTGNGKVVCAKFPAQSVDEEYLRKLSEPFGKIVKVLMFPSLAFVELGSCDQAKDLVKYYTSNTEYVNGEEVTFNISSTFNFLQSSRVVSFIPAPVGDDGFSDLINITKRFGVPIYTLFLPSMAFIEMAITADAQKLVDYYSSNTLKINGVVIKVAFSGEYNTLMRVSAAKRYEEEPTGPKRKRSPTPPRRREEPERSSSRQRAKDGERGRSRDRAGQRSSRSLSSERASLGGRSHSTEGRCRTDRLKRESSTPEPSQQIKLETELKLEIPASPKSAEPQTCEISETSQKAATEIQPDSSGEDSDIEGMEVIGEDGEDVEDLDNDAMEVLDEEEEEEEEAEQEDDTKGLNPPETSSSLEPGLSGELREEAGKLGVNLEVVVVTIQSQMEPVCVSEPQTLAQQDPKTQPVVKEEKDFPVDMENLITLDELCEDQCVDDEENNKDKTKADKQPVGMMDAPAESLETVPPREETEPHPGETETTPDNLPETTEIPPEETKTLPEKTETPPDQLTPLEDKQIKPEHKEDQSKGAKQDHQTMVENKTEDCSFNNQPQPGPVEDAVEPAKPTKPIGIEFVRPVVGYFCNLCKVIYADEDEAKTEHCKSLAHYQKYQEQTGKDPWGS